VVICYSKDDKKSFWEDRKTTMSRGKFTRCSQYNLFISDDL